MSAVQAISGAGKTFETMPEILDNVIPYIGGEEEKSEKEPLKIWVIGTSSVKRCAELFETIGHSSFA